MSEKYLRTTKENIVNAIGTELCWGWSPAVNMVEHVPAAFLPENRKKDAGPKAAQSRQVKDEEEEDPVLRAAGGQAEEEEEEAEEPLNFLLLGAADVRHQLKTVAQMRRSTNAPVHFYVYEPNLRVHCRHILFAYLLFDSMTLDELEDRVALFLDLFANSQLRETTAFRAKMLIKKALRVLGYDDGDLAQLFDFDSLMKSKEKDFIEEQMRQWAKDMSQFDVAGQWNHRLRAEMAERYDNRDNIIDWDFNMNLADYTPFIKYQEYREWRNTGIAYDYCRVNPIKNFQYNYVVPNKTLAHFDAKGKGQFFGDVKNGPYMAFGADTENSNLKRREIDGQMKYANGIVALHNVRAWLYEILTGKKWEFGEHKFAWDDAKNYNPLPPDCPRNVELSPKLPNVKFIFCGLDLDRVLLRLRERPKPVRFHGVFVGATSTQLLATKGLYDAILPHGYIIAETLKFVVDAEDPAKEAFVEKVLEMVGSAGFKLSGGLTRRLHVNQAEPRKYEIELNDHQKKQQKRLLSPHHLGLVRSDDTVGTGGGGGGTVEAVVNEKLAELAAADKKKAQARKPKVEKDCRVEVLDD